MTPNIVNSRHVHSTAPFFKEKHNARCVSAGHDSSRGERTWGIESGVTSRRSRRVALCVLELHLVCMDAMSHTVALGNVTTWQCIKAFILLKGHRIRRTRANDALKEQIAHLTVIMHCYTLQSLLWKGSDRHSQHARSISNYFNTIIAVPTTPAKY